MFWRPYSFDNVFILLSHSNDNLGGYIILCSNFIVLSFSSVQVSHSVVSDSLRPHELQHARPPCPSPSPGVHSDSRPSSQWCHPAISASVVPFSSCPQSLPASESFPMSRLFPWGGRSTGASALASFLPKKSRADLLQNGLVIFHCLLVIVWLMVNADVNLIFVSGYIICFFFLEFFKSSLIFHVFSFHFICFYS